MRALPAAACSRRAAAAQPAAAAAVPQPQPLRRQRVASSSRLHVGSSHSSRSCQRRQLACAAQLQQQPPPPPSPPPPEAAQPRPSQLRVSLLRAASAAELRAAGYLRAATFYTYPADRSEYSTRMHRRMKGDAEWESVTRKVEGTEPDYKALRVTCLVAAIDDDPGCAVAAAAGAELDASAKLPADPAAQQPPRIVVGSLDVNQGPVLPAEELVGRLPPVDQATRRAYLSNVCVAPAARRHGVAAALITEAAGLAAAAGVEHLYVHVVADNGPARRLYGGLGFEQEAEESEGFARALRRPRRLLLHKQLAAAGAPGGR